MRLVLVRGCPGQGKSMFSRTVFPDAFRVENDMWHVRDGKYRFDAKSQSKAMAWCFDTCEKALAAGMDCIVSNTLTKTGYVKAYMKLAEKYGAEFIVYRMRGEFRNTHAVPDGVLRNMREKFKDWPGETYVYPNVNQDRNDPCYRPYMFTNLKVGDRVAVKRFADGKETHTLIVNADGSRSGDSFEMETCTATVTGIEQGTYDYLNISYVEDDTGKSGICMSGDCAKIEEKA